MQGPLLAKISLRAKQMKLAWVARNEAQETEHKVGADNRTTPSPALMSASLAPLLRPSSKHLLRTVQLYLGKFEGDRSEVPEAAADINADTGSPLLLESQCAPVQGGSRPRALPMDKIRGWPRWEEHILSLSRKIKASNH